MDVGLWARRTVDEDPSALPSAQIYVQGRRVLHDLHFFYRALVPNMGTGCKKAFWKDCKRYWGRAEVDGAHIWWRTQNTSPVQLANVCDSVGLYKLLWCLVDFSRTGALVDKCLEFLTSACSRVRDLPQDQPALVKNIVCRGGESRPLFIHRGGKVSGLYRAVRGGLPVNSGACLSRVWAGMLASGRVGGPFDADNHDLVDIVVFTTLAASSQRARNRSLGDAAVSWLADLRSTLVKLVANCMDTYILEHYLLSHKADKPPPAIVSPKKPGKETRRYTQVQPEAVWTMIQNSLRSACSLQVLVRSRQDDPEAGGSESAAVLWMAKHQAMYVENRTMAFHSVSHLNIVADPGTHSKHETVVSVAWSWEDRVAAHCDCQRLRTIARLLPSEEDLPDHIAELLAANRLVRVATYQQLQALSNTIRGLGWRGLIDFSLPESLQHLRAVTRDEVRVVRPSPDSGATDMALLFNKVTRQSTPVLPAATTRGPAATTRGQGWSPSYPLLVLVLDQGSLGTAGAAYMEGNLGMMVLSKWDKYHRCVRDIRLSLERVARGLFLKAQLYTSYLWGVNYKPYGTGLFGTQKKEALDAFLAEQSTDGAPWHKYGERIAHDAGLPWDTEEDRQRVWASLPDIAGSFCQAREICKLGRWFSWNDCAKQQLPEYWAGKMIYEWFLATTQDPDDSPVTFDNLDAAARAKTPYTELRALKQANGGLKLAYRLMTTGLCQHAWMLYICTRGCWDWYANQVRSIKTPEDGCRELLRMCGGGWQRDPHLSETIMDALLDAGSLSKMGIGLGASAIASRLLSLVLRIISHRAWSLAVRHHGPPECYAALLPLAPTQGKQAAAHMMRDQWNRLMLLEQKRATYEPAAKLWGDISYAKSSPIRLLHVLFEKDRWSPASIAGQHTLRGLLETLPDSKLVEDLHNAVRTDARKCRTDKRCTVRVQDVLNSSTVFEDRGINHSCRVQKDLFVRQFKSVRWKKGFKGRHRSSSHRMPQVFAGVMARKTWPTVSETSMQKSIAAWEWLQSGHERLCHNAGPNVTLASALFSRLADVETVMMKESEDGETCVVCLGHASWAMLCWPVDILARDTDDMRTLRLRTPSGVFFEHIIDPQQWKVLPMQAERRDSVGIVMQQIAPPEPLLRMCLRKPSELSADDLRRLASHLDVEGFAGRGRHDLLGSIADKVGEGDATFIAEVQAADRLPRKATAVELLLQDAVFEAAFEEMPEDDQREFPDIQQRKQEGQVLGRLAKRKVEVAQRKRAAGGRLLQQRRVRRRVAAGAAAPAQEAPENGEAAPRTPPVGPEPEGPVVAAPPPAAEVPAAGPAAEVPAAGPVGDPVIRVARGVSWGPNFALARTHRGGTLESVTVTCLCHHTEGLRCNKSVTLGTRYTEEAATLRIKEWCIRGLDIPDGVGARAQHMRMRPHWADADIRTGAELDASAGA